MCRVIMAVGIKALEIIILIERLVIANAGQRLVQMLILLGSCLLGLFYFLGSDVSSEGAAMPGQFRT